MGAIFAVFGAAAFVWSAVKYQVSYYALMDTFLPQFQGGYRRFMRFPFMPYILPRHSRYRRTTYMPC
jgi:hypothetical protein